MRKFLVRHNKQSGFTLIELMISLALGLVIASAVIQVMVSNQVTEKLNRAVASTQESGRFIINRLRSEMLMVGLYDQLSPNINTSVDIVDENVFVRNNPVILPGTFAVRNALGSIQGASGANDTLVVSLQGSQDCRGYNLGYLNDDEFYVVNEYFVSDNRLRCRGFDGRYLRGQKAAEGHNSHNAITILDDVESFQVTYGVTSMAATNGSAIPTRFVTADGIQNEIDNGKLIVAIRIAIVVKGDSEISMDKKASFKLLNENSFTVSDFGLYKSFETTITLRNMKNFVRSSA
ncbi:PilW family protein [Glaciecola sp. MH2013]|uniref:PilW family protein n=1 Tax=Glaciecola sp. MH2013 TaxID=2785524 RepID=UPI00189F439C|nr:PilW family protein [Glaciecola sp. MH2013]MBF7074745.1 PilW family protein [Glaciecola sp. MH2013]